MIIVIVIALAAIAVIALAVKNQKLNSEMDALKASSKDDFTKLSAELLSEREHVSSLQTQLSAEHQNVLDARNIITQNNIEIQSYIATGARLTSELECALETVSQRDATIVELIAAKAELETQVATLDTGLADIVRLASDLRGVQTPPAFSGGLITEELSEDQLTARYC